MAQYLKKLNGYVIKDEEAREKIENMRLTVTGMESEIANIKNGTTAVGKATNAENVTSQINGTNISDIFETDTAGNVRAIRAKSAIYDGSGNNIFDTYAMKSFVKDTYATKDELAGKQTAYVFETESAMTDELKNAAKNKYQLGNQLLIKATGVPDYWISAVLDNNNGKYGFYQISELETEKVDLTGYATEAYVDGEISAVKTDTNNNYIKKGAAATVKRLTTDIPTTGIDQEIYLARGGSVEVTKANIKPAILSNGIYTTTVEVPIGSKLKDVKVTAKSMVSGSGAVISATLSSYTPATGIATVEVRSTIKDERIAITLTGTQTVSPYGAIYKDNEYSYIKLYASEAEANGHYVLKEEYNNENDAGELNLYVVYE